MGAEDNSCPQRCNLKKMVVLECKKEFLDIS
jgi:hypothetical protein